MLPPRARDPQRPWKGTHTRGTTNMEAYLDRTVASPAHAAGALARHGGATTEKRRRRDAKSEPRPLNQQSKQIIWSICNDIPTMRLAREAFEKRLFNMPFEVTLGAKGNNVASGFTFLNEKMRERVIKREWMPWLHDVHRWLTMYGIAPYYFEHFSVSDAANGTDASSPGRKAKSDRPAASSKGGGGGKGVGDGTETFVPRCPDVYAGDIEVYTQNGKKKFQWRWSKDIAHPRAGDVDKGFAFLVKDSPTLLGDYTSSISALIRDTGQLELYRLLEQGVAIQTVKPQHVIEFHPSGGGSSNNALEGAPLGSTSFFSIASGQQPEGPAPNPYMQSVLAYQQQAANPITRDIYREMGIRGWAGQSVSARPTVRAGASEDARARLSTFLANNPSVGVLDEGKYPDDAIRLNPFETHKKVAPPTLPNMHYLEHLQRMDDIYALAGGYPLSMLLNRGVQQGTRFEASQAHLIEELRNWGKFYTDHLTDIFYRAYAPFFHKLRRDSEIHRRLMTYGTPPTDAHLLAMEQKFKITVFFPKAPHLTFEQLKDYYAHRMITEEEFREYALTNVNLEASDKPPEYERAVKTLYDYKQYEAPDPTEGGSLKRKAPAAAPGSEEGSEGNAALRKDQEVENKGNAGDSARAKAKESEKERKKADKAKAKTKTNGSGDDKKRKRADDGASGKSGRDAKKSKKDK